MEYPLFAGYAIERKPFRPLGVVSDFVVEQLPKELADIREGRKHVRQLTAYTEKLIASLGNTPFFNGASVQDQSLLDLLFIESGIVHSQGMAGRRLVGLVNKLAKKAGRIPGLTYEDLIFVNLQNQDVRLFTSGDISLSERDFYEGHRRIENILENCIMLCQKVIADPAAKQNSKKILAITTGVKKIEGYTGELHRAMPKEHFSIFRQYFLSHPYRGFKGPSGAFSARFPILEVLLAGERLPDETLRYYMDDNYVYLPRRDRLVLKDAFHGVGEKKNDYANFAIATAERTLRSSGSMRQCDTEVSS